MKKSIYGLVVSCVMMTSIVSLGQNRCSNSSQQPQPTACPGFKTFTQGAWGANPCGGNAASYMQANFAVVFPTGVTIGCTNKLKFTSSNAVRSFLPSGSTPSALPAGTLVNPSNYNNVFAGQLLALTLNVKFDDYFSNFAPAAGKLKDLVIASGPFAGMTVQQLLDNANQKIGGCAAMNRTFSEYNSAISTINSTYDNGVVSGSFLTCPGVTVTPLSATLNAGGVNCYGNATGSITVQAAGGTAPYTYVFGNSPASSSAVKSGLAAGTYTVVVTDASNQSVTLTAVVNQNPLLTSTPSSTNSLCNSLNGPASGTATVYATGGVAPYSVQWSNSATGSSISALSSGNYTYVLTDAVGCQSTGSVQISQPSAISIGLTTSEFIRCTNECTGELISSVSGGTGAYTYLWSDGQDSEHAFNLCSGVYSLTVTDANGCVAVQSSDLLDNPNPIVITPEIYNPNLCSYDCNASITLNVSGGESPYFITWSNGGSSLETTNICAGSYSASITDSRGCVTEINDIEVVNPPVIEISNLDIGAVSGCNVNACDATASVDFTGGYPPYQLAWNVSNETSNSLSNLCMGTSLSIDVTDQMNCVAHFDLGVIDCIPLPGEAFPNTDRIAHVSQSKSVNIFPNPVRNEQASLVFETYEEEVIWVSVYNTTGALLSTTQVAATVGSNYLNLDFTNFAKQTYLVTLVTKADVIKKLVSVE